MIANAFTLNSVFDTRKSFYGKAVVMVFTDGTKRLYSYNTLVCTIDPLKNVSLSNVKKQSATTRRHVKEFLRQNNLERYYELIYGDKKIARYKTSDGKRWKLK